MLKQIRLPFFTVLFLFSIAADPLRAAPSQESLIATLQSGAPPQEKWDAAHQLAGIATPAAVPKLAPLLADEQLCDLARYVLEPLPSSSVDEAFRAALSTAKGPTLAGIITSIGVRRDAKAVSLLAKFLDDADPTILSASLAALGKIGTVPAAKAIEARISSASAQARPQLWAGLVQCAETLRAGGHRGDASEVFHWIVAEKAPARIHAAGVRGVILTGGKESLKLLADYLPTETSTVLRLVQSELPGPGVTDVLFAGLPKLPPEPQVLVVEALGQRGDATSIAALISVARDGDKSLRLTAIRDVAHDVSLVPALVDFIADTDKDIAQAACDRLASLPETEADAAILKFFSSESPDLRLAATQMASRRRLHSATPTLVTAAASQDTSLAAAALTALGQTASETDVDALCGLLSTPSVDADAVESLLVAVNGRARHADVYVNRIIELSAQSPAAARCTLLRVLGDIGCPKALEAVRAAAKDNNEDVKQTAIRTLAKWPGTEAVSAIAKAKPNAFFPFCIDWHDAKKRNYVQQAAMLKELGYEGVGHIFLDGVAERLKALDAAGLKLFQITMTLDLTPGKPAYDARFKDVLALVKGRHVQFDLLCNGRPPSDASVDARAVEILREMSDLAQDSGAQLLLYPHQGCWVERIEDAVRVADKVNRPNVGVMFNLCHWLRVDKQRSYKPLLAEAMPRLWAVSICGADEFDPAPGWAHYIQPLDKGSFDVGLLLKTLKDLGYTGPIGLQCYGIGGDAQEHLARSMAAWQKLKVNINPSAKSPGYDDTPFLPNSQWRVHDHRRPQPPIVDPGDGNPSQQIAQPPDDAIVLFDGKDLSKWRGGDEKGIENSCINILKTGELNTREVFGDCQLHAEWCSPTKPDDPMEWGNSGIYFQGLYELQIIESHDSYIYADGNAGAIYGQTPPLVNSSRKPGQWQSFDVVFTAPVFKGEKLVKPAYFTVFQNGVLVQNHQAVIGPTVHRALPKYDDATRVNKGPILLQCHGSPVLFRNIWIRPLESKGNS